MAIDEKEIDAMQTRLARVEKAHAEFQERIAALEAERKALFEETLKKLDEQTIEEIMAKLDARRK